jgi:hypothetical protein
VVGRTVLKARAFGNSLIALCLVPVLAFVT